MWMDLRSELYEKDGDDSYTTVTSKTEKRKLSDVADGGDTSRTRPNGTTPTKNDTGAS